MWLLAFLGLVALTLANPAPVNEDLVLRACQIMVDNKALMLSDMEAFFNATYPSYEAFCSSLGFKIDRETVMTGMRKTDKRITQRDLDKFTYATCVSERASDRELREQCRMETIKRE